MQQSPNSDYRLQAQAQIVANEFARAYNRKHKAKIPIPVPMRYDLETDLALKHPKAAGMALSDSMEVVLNMTLFRDNVKETLNETIPHEVAHLAQFTLEKKKGIRSKGHGPLWQSLMSSMSKKPTKIHTMDTSKAMSVYKAALKAHKQALKRDSDEELDS